MLPFQFHQDKYRRNFLAAFSILESPNELMPVWPDPDGEMRGVALKPLFHSVPKAAREDPKLYEWLALVDALRTGRARERELAAKIIGSRLDYATLR